ncbi:hypothetical protein [Gordonia rhizosphera]|uniref:hypothetical protein n=1 Tax=Gordonia rhizosphera TaxID=83341 RepID=UPI0014613FFA|nr:hypothetical protein [Gordonia rhizosphera]
MTGSPLALNKVAETSAYSWAIRAVAGRVEEAADVARTFAGVQLIAAVAVIVLVMTFVAYRCVAWSGRGLHGRTTRNRLP